MTHYLFVGLIVFICQTQICTAEIKYYHFIFHFMITTDKSKKVNFAHHEYTFKRSDSDPDSLKDSQIERNIRRNLDRLGYFNIELTMHQKKADCYEISKKTFETQPTHTHLDIDRKVINPLNNAPHFDHSEYTKSQPRKS